MVFQSFSIQSLMKIVVTVVAVVFVLEVALVSFENLSVITTLNRSRVFVFEEDPGMSITTNSNGPAGGDKRSMRFSSLFDGFSRTNSSLVQ